MPVEGVLSVMGKTLVKSFKVDEEQYERWEDFLEESIEVESFSQLVRLAVHTYVEGDSDPATDDFVDARDDETGEILEELRSLRSEHQENIEDLRRLQETAQSDNSRPLKLALLNIIPKKPIELDHEQIMDFSNWAMTTAEVGEIIDVPKWSAEMILSDLSKEYGQLEQIQHEDDGTKYWYLRS
jgi:predicted transcriptional regulator